MTKSYKFHTIYIGTSFKNVWLRMISSKTTLKTLCIIALLNIVFISGFSISVLAQTQRTETKALALVLEEEYDANKKWKDPLNMVDGDETTYSTPLMADYYDSEGVYYNLRLKRPVNSRGLPIEDLGQISILKVQVRLVYGLQKIAYLERYSYLDFEGYVQRLENVEILGPGFDNKLIEIFDVTRTNKAWDINSALQWDEIVIRFSAEQDDLESKSFRLYEVQLLVTYVPKRN